MTILKPYDLNGVDREIFTLASQFSVNRFQERQVADWALNLNKGHFAERAALWDNYQWLRGEAIKEPWLSFWGWLFEAWENEPPLQQITIPYQIGELIKRGDRSRMVIDAIVSYVRPYPEVSAPKDWFGTKKIRRVPKKVSDLAVISLTSGQLPDFKPFNLETVNSSFLIELADALEAALLYGLDVGRRLSGGGSEPSWQLGGLKRVYAMPAPREDPDQFSTGIAPTTKFLFMVVNELFKKDKHAASQYLDRWISRSEFIFIRLWAGLARQREYVGAKEIERLMLTAPPNVFWDLQNYPEFAELRAIRFSEFSPRGQLEVSKRISRLPPPNLWTRDLASMDLAELRNQRAIREMQRIEVAGGTLPLFAKEWLANQTLGSPFAEMIASVDEDFPGEATFRWVASDVDHSFDLLQGRARLEALESSLSAERTFNENPSEAARGWISTPGHLKDLLDDLERSPNAGASYPRVWEALYWVYPSDATTNDDKLAQRTLAQRILHLLMLQTNDSQKRKAVGISTWLSAWASVLEKGSELESLWFAIWPLVVEATNSQKEENLSFNEADSSDEHKFDIDVLNNPAGRMVGVFLEFCPNLTEVPAPFEDGSLAKMRYLIVNAPGRSGIVGRVRLLEHLGYFLKADPAWTEDHLFSALRYRGPEAGILWRAISRRTQFPAIKFIGKEMAEVAVDTAFDRVTRKAMAFSLVVHLLNCYWDGKATEVSESQVQQMLRASQDEIRAHCACAFSDFIQSVSSREGDEIERRKVQAIIFLKAVKPILLTVWPQERSLTSPGVAKALADLPAASGDAFPDAVKAIERFMVPFEAWSLLEFGLYGDDSETPRLERIDTSEKADAFLTLLDQSIGYTEEAVIPFDLSQALERISVIQPQLQGDNRYKRLLTLSRR